MAKIQLMRSVTILVCIIGISQAETLGSLIKRRISGAYSNSIKQSQAQGIDGKTIQVGGVQMPMLTLPGLPQPGAGGGVSNVVSVCPDSSVCAPSGQCLLAGGVSVGRCAMGFMVCCIRREEVPQACSATSSLISIRDKVSSITDSYTAKSCRYEVYKAADNICQLKLEIETFQLASPRWREDCSDGSRLSISESVTVPNNFPLCGTHNETTLFLAYGRSSRISLDFRTTLVDSYKVRITQIECNSAERIPDQCLENYESPYGVVKSFGFPNYMINNQKYTVCINSKAVSDTGNIKWQECTMDEAGSDSNYNFILSEYYIDVPIHLPTTPATGPPLPSIEPLNETDSTVFLSSEGSSCLRTSYIEVHGDGKRCGAKFVTSAANSVRSDSRPYMLTVNVQKDSAANLPDFAYYHIRGLVRNSTTPGVADPLPPNDCNYGTKEKPNVLSTQGFEACQVATRTMGGLGSGRVLTDLCLCAKKLGDALPEQPLMRDDMIERKGFCLKYSMY